MARLTESLRSPRATFSQVMGYVRYHAALAHFPVLTSAFDLKPLSLDVPSQLCSCNPSIIDYEDGWMVVVRTHNWYVVTNGRVVEKLGDRRRLQNESWVSTYTADFKLLHQVPLKVRDDALPPEDRDRFLRNGIADIRVFRANGQYCLIGSGCNIAEKLDTMVVGSLAGDEFVADAIVRSPKGSLVEKNWMPIEGAAEIKAIYAMNPFSVMAITDGKAEEVFSKKTVPRTPEYRGSSQVLAYDGGLLCIAHRVIIYEWRRIYLHRFVHLTPEWEVKAMSPEFFIEKKGIEFCAGLARRGNCYVMSYGVDDITARAVVLQKSAIERLLSSAPWRCPTN